MFKNSSIAFVVAGLTLALGACGSSEDTAAAPADAKPEIALSPIQQANFERFNRDEFLADLTALEEKRGDGEGPDAADFAALDQDGDGKLTAAEFAVARIPATAVDDGSGTEEVIRTFFAADNDGDIALNAEEFAAATGTATSEGLAADVGGDTSES